MQKPENSCDNLMRKMHRLHLEGRVPDVHVLRFVGLEGAQSYSGVDAILDGWRILGMIPVVVIMRMFEK